MIKKIIITSILLGLIVLVTSCSPSMKGYVKQAEYDQFKEASGDQVQRISQEINKTNQELVKQDKKIEKNAEYIEGNKEEIEKLDKRVVVLEEEDPEDPPPPPPSDTAGTWLVFKALGPLKYGTVNFDVTGLSSAGSVKDVMAFFGRGLTVEAYNTFRYDIRKYGEHLQIMKSVLGRNTGAFEDYWDNRAKIYWIADHTYHFTITWDDNGVIATRYDTETGETNNWRGSYPDWMKGGVFNPIYICIGWNPKYGIPPGGYYFNIVLPSQTTYDLVKYKP